MRATLTTQKLERLPTSNAVDRKPHAGDRDKQDGGDQSVVADKEVGAEDDEREDENGNPDYPGKEEPVPVQAGVSFVMPFTAHCGLSCCLL